MAVHDIVDEADIVVRTHTRIGEVGLERHVNVAAEAAFQVEREGEEGTAPAEEVVFGTGGAGERAHPGANSNSQIGCQPDQVTDGAADRTRYDLLNLRIQGRLLCVAVAAERLVEVIHRAGRVLQRRNLLF